MKNKTFYYFFKLINKKVRPSDYKPILLRLSVLTESDAVTSIFSKFQFVCLSIFLPLLIVLRLRYEDSDSIYFDTSYDEQRNKERETFINHYSDSNFSLTAGKNFTFYYSQFKFSYVLQIMSLWGATVKASLMNLFWTTNSWKPLFLSVINGITAILQQNTYKEAYIFSLYYPSSYLTAFFLSKYTDIKVSLVSGSTPLYEMNRYIAFPKASLILCSKYQMEEYKSYSNLTWTSIENVEVWGLEEQLHLENVVVSEPIFDIGIFSDASWARENGTWRSNDIEKIRSGVLKDNFKYESLDMIMKTCCKLKREIGLSIKVYLHPFERELMSVHSIEPPYVHYLKENDISYSYNGKNSLANIYESRIGVSTWSTIIMDRWHLDLVGLIHFEERQRAKPYNNNPDHFGEYKKYVFLDSNDLEKKIKGFCNFKKSKVGYGEAH